MTDAEEAIYEHPTASDTIIEDRNCGSNQPSCNALVACIYLQHYDEDFTNTT